MLPHKQITLEDIVVSVMVEATTLNHPVVKIYFKY